MSQALRGFARSVADRHTRAVSVDVFDTLLLRTTTPEVVKFHRIGAAQAQALAALGHESVDSREMLQLRLLAAESAYRNVALVRGAREPGIEVILGIMATHLVRAGQVAEQDRDEVFDRLLAVELAEERKDLTANRRLLPILASARGRGLPVVAVSDMYLRREHVRYLIDAAGAGDAVSEVYVSSDFGVSKASGDLYRHVCEHLGIHLDELVHAGDNRHSDVLMADRLGVRGHYLPRSPRWRGAREVRRRMFVRTMRRPA